MKNKWDQSPFTEVDNRKNIPNRDTDTATQAQAQVQRHSNAGTARETRCILNLRSHHTPSHHPLLHPIMISPSRIISSLFLSFLLFFTNRHVFAHFNCNKTISPDYTEQVRYPSSICLSIFMQNHLILIFVAFEPQPVSQLFSYLSILLSPSLII